MSEKQNDVIVTPFTESALQDYADDLRNFVSDDEVADSWLDKMAQSITELSYLPYRL